MGYHESGTDGYVRRGSETWAGTVGPLSMWCSLPPHDSAESPHQIWPLDLGLPSLHNYKDKFLFFVNYPVLGIVSNRKWIKTCILSSEFLYWHFPPLCCLLAFFPPTTGLHCWWKPNSPIDSCFWIHTAIDPSGPKAWNLTFVLSEYLP